MLDVKAELTDKDLGEVEVLYDPAEVTSEDLKQAVPLASGEKHDFTVVSVIEEG